MERMLRMLVTAVARLSWPPDTQAWFLERIGTHPSADELLTEASMSLDYRDSLGSSGLLTDQDLQRLGAVSAAIEQVQTESAFSVGDLNGDAWATLRSAAQVFLSGEEF